MARQGLAAEDQRLGVVGRQVAWSHRVRRLTLEDVKQLLGHSSITLTSNTYGHVLEQRQRQVAQAMDTVLSSNLTSRP